MKEEGANGGGGRKMKKLQKKKCCVDMYMLVNTSKNLYNSRIQKKRLVKQNC